MSKNTESKLTTNPTPDQVASMNAANTAPVSTSNSVIPMANPEGPAVIKRDIKAELLALREKDRKPVRGMFKFYECQGGLLEFSFRKYAQDQVERYNLVDGQIYTLPLGVAKHLNQNGWYPVYAHVPGENFAQTVRVEKKVRRFGFQSLEFTDEKELLHENDGAGIMTVQYI